MVDRVIFWGTYDLSKPRTRILRDGLRDIGVDVVEIHADVWPKHADKSQISKLTMIFALLRALANYPLLVWRYLLTPKHDVVIVPYLGQFDVLFLWLFARLRGRPIVWDMFLSLYDTIVNDRQIAHKWSPPSMFLWMVEWLSCRAANIVLMDTQAHAAHISRLFSVPPDRTSAVPVGVELDAFARQPAPEPHGGRARILFYGQLIPLHGVDTILKAALSERGQKSDWRIIGKGQHQQLIADALAAQHAPHVQWDAWVQYEDLKSAIVDADICLGIFGSSEKAASVVPNKVYQCLSVGRSVITRASRAMTEVFPDLNPGLRLVPHSDADELLDAIDALKADGYPIIPTQNLDLARPKDIAQMLCMSVLNPLTIDTK